MNKEHTLATAAAKAGMSEVTARRYRRLGKLPGEVKKPHDWTSQADAFAGVWDEVKEMLELSPGLEAKTLFAYLLRKYPDRFVDGQLRTFQRRVKIWRATEGPALEVFFPQIYTPGERSESDFTSMNDRHITIARQRFDHLLYHFVLPYSDWETGSICFSESFESLSEGLQNAFFELGGVTRIHQTDSLTSAVRKLGSPERFTERYKALMSHYGIEGRHTNPASPNENGDIEQRHNRFKKALEQALLLRGSRDFESRADYGRFLDRLFVELNRPRRKRLAEELAVLGQLPTMRLESYRRIIVRVRPSSTIRVYKNTYSVHSRLIGERVEVRLYHDRLRIYYAQRKVDEQARLRGTGKHAINYRHVIDWLVCKPGAFANYAYKADLFPTHRFRLAYDVICGAATSELAASRRYLAILYLAARENETAVDQVLQRMLAEGCLPDADAIKYLIRSGNAPRQVVDIEIAPVHLAAYDALLTRSEVVS